MGLSFEEARKQLDALKELSCRQVACDWKNPVERVTWRRGVARFKRMEAVEAGSLPGFRCPCCLKSQFKARSWVLLPVSEVTKFYLELKDEKDRLVLLGIFDFITAGGAQKYNEIALCRSCCMREPFRGIWGNKRTPAHHRIAKRTRKG